MVGELSEPIVHFLGCSSMVLGRGQYLHGSEYLFEPLRPVRLAVGAELIIRSDCSRWSGRKVFVGPVLAREPIIIQAPETSMFICGRCDNYSVR
jgi:hypothetical protein